MEIAPEPPDRADTASLENAARIALTAFFWWRADLSRELCEAYWRDVHGIMFARAPGLWQYRQLRLGPNRSRAELPGSRISFDAPGTAQPQGIGHALFVSESDLAAFAGDPLPGDAIPNDARNFIGRAGALLSVAGGGCTFVDRLGRPAMQGAPSAPTFVLCLVARHGVSSANFHKFLAEHVGRSWSSHPGVMRLRTEPLPPYHQSATSTPGVPHRWPSDETYLGLVELAMRDEGEVDELLGLAADGGVAEHVKAIHTYPVREIYTLVSAGRPTDVGLRGYPAVQAIDAIGAENQRDQDLLGLLFGDAGHRGAGRRTAPD